MRSPRKFYLEAASGERRDLNGADGVWLTEPAGLGLSLSPGFANARQGFFAVVQTDDVPQGSVYGTLIFTGPTPYARYSALLDWALAAPGLTLVYSPGGEEFYRRVSLVSLTKGEIKAPGWLSCELTLTALTPWYRPTQQRLSMESTSAAAMRYPFIYDDDLIYASGNVGSMTALLQAAGHLPSALSLSYAGAAVNPTVRLTGQSSGTVYGEISLDATLAESDRLEISTRYLDPYIRRVSADGSVEDLLPQLDLAHDPWLRLPLAEPVQLSLLSTAALEGAAVLRVYDYFWSV